MSMCVRWDSWLIRRRYLSSWSSTDVELSHQRLTWGWSSHAATVGRWSTCMG